MEIITLGNCCKKSRQNHENTVIAAKNCNIKEEVKNLGDIKDIMKYGVISTPAIIIDGKVVSMGKVLTVEQIEKLINERK
ncbi:MAG: thioredoxin family protein [Clostridiales bacterium]|nr:thioredoxin family protein [Clostridiales bacterium]